jgi:hypothetical protein
MVRPFSASMAFGLLALLGPAPGGAADLMAVRAQVPFSFKVGERTLPSGEYSFRFDGAEQPGVLRVRGEHGGGGVLIQALRTEIPEGSGDKPKLVFEKEGEEYVLSQVLDPGHVGVQLLDGRDRREAERVAVLAR